MKKNNLLNLLGITLLLSSTLSLSGCGLTQKVSDGAIGVTKAIFYKQIKIAHLDFVAREALNTNDNGITLSTIIRIYQLNNADSFNSSDYTTLFTGDRETLKSTLIAQKDIRIRPGESIAIDMPMEDGTEFIAIAVMFNHPDLITNNWRVVIPKKHLLVDTPHRLVLSEQSVILTPSAEDK